MTLGTILIVPLGGKGERFKKFGYKQPKPLIKILGKEIICWLFDNLNLTKVNKIIIPYNSDLQKYRFEEFLINKYPKIIFSFIKLHNQTRGACETLLLALNTLTQTELNHNIISIDGDNFFTEDIISIYEKSSIKNTIFYFLDTQVEPIYSYLQLDTNNKIIDFVEKTKISDNACCGVYCFETGNILKSFCQKVINLNILQKGEFYISSVVRQMIHESITFTGTLINKSQYICLGTPLHLKIFCNNLPNNNLLTKKYRFCFDLDNTLVTFPTINGDYSSVMPIQENINFVNYLKHMGHIIIIYTARRMKTHQNCVGKVLKDIGKLTFDTLEKFGIIYDEIYFGKPQADFYIDDLGVNCFDDLEKELGFYQTKINPRSFNSIELSSIETYIKKSTSCSLNGEIYWYSNIPNEIKNMFPVMFRFDTNNSWYEIEKIKGIPLSKLYLSGDMTTDLFNHVINNISNIHSSKSNESNIKNINIYANYNEKIKLRYKNYNYDKFPDAKFIYDILISFFENYETDNLGCMSVIHGDPVFTNILVDQNGKIKFIDMRGKLSNLCTIYGDRNYDFAKVYQSLIGYDEILENKILTNEYKQLYISEFENYIINNYGSNTLKYIKYITISLLFSLIPLHNNNKCEKYIYIAKNLLDKINL
jgi:capsule biosynthesis phosphatase